MVELRRSVKRERIDGGRNSTLLPGRESGKEVEKWDERMWKEGRNFANCIRKKYKRLEGREEAERKKGGSRDKWRANKKIRGADNPPRGSIARLSQRLRNG